MKIKYASSWLFTKIIPRCTFNRTQKTTGTPDNAVGPGQESKYYTPEHKVTLLNQTEIRTGDIPETSISTLYSNTK
jgi:hypothetical protein